jgi:hypothetical protein
VATLPNPYPISPFFSFRWVNENPVLDPRYNTLPTDSLVDDSSYAQPWQTNDKGQIQYTNIFIPTCKLFTCEDIFVKDIVMTPIDPPLINTDLICYNGEVDFSDVDPGRYYLKLTYTDENDILQDWRTSPLDVEDEHPGTLLYEVSNDINEKGAIFTGIVINCRVHGMLRSPIPKSDSEDYEDQYDNLEQLSSVPSENWTNLIGNSYGNVSNYFQIPWWVIQKFNLLYSLNNVLIDGQPFAKISGAEFKPFRVENQLNENGYWGIDIQPNAAYPSGQYETGDEPEGEYVVIYKKKTYINVAADFSIAGTFTDDTNLIKVILFNYGHDDFTLKLGTTLGGDDIRTFEITYTDSEKNVLLVEFPFTGNSMLYLTGLTGTDCKLIVVYDDFLATNTPPPEPITKWQKDTLYWYVENTPGTFVNEFNAATGLGQVGSDHEGCVIADDYIGRTVVGWDRSDAASRGTDIGDPDNLVMLTQGQIPEITLTLGKDRKGGNSGSDILSALTPGPFGVNNYNVGGDGDVVDIQNYAKVTVPFYYIGT